MRFEPLTIINMFIDEDLVLHVQYKIKKGIWYTQTKINLVDGFERLDINESINDL